MMSLVSLISRNRKKRWKRNQADRKVCVAGGEKRTSRGLKRFDTRKTATNNVLENACSGTVDLLRARVSVQLRKHRQIWLDHQL